MSCSRKDRTSSLSGAGRRSCAVFLSLCLVLVALTGCERKVFLNPVTAPQTPKAPQLSGPAYMEQQAHAAWTAGNMLEAERLYGVLARTGGVNAEARRTALERLAVASLANRHPHTALEALEEAKPLAGDTQSMARWLELWTSAVMQLPFNDGLRRGTMLAEDSTRPPMIRAGADAVLLARTLPRERMDRARAMDAAYQQALPEAQQAMERGLFAALAGLPDADMAGLTQLVNPVPAAGSGAPLTPTGLPGQGVPEAAAALAPGVLAPTAPATELPGGTAAPIPATTASSASLGAPATPGTASAATGVPAAVGAPGAPAVSAVTAETTGAVSPYEHRYPWSVLLLESARRARISQRPDAAALLNRVSGADIFAAPGLLDQARSGPARSSTVPVQGTAVLRSGCTALALPMSGTYSSIGWKVAQGATAAQQELATTGVQMEVTVLNTEDPAWLDQLAALPPHCVTVGGPLRPETFAAAKGRGLLGSRAFFAFLSRLEGEDEGHIAWRFFSSPEDQVRAVLTFAHGIGINTFGSLYPEDEYGRRMSDLFMQLAGTGMVKSAAYPPKEIKALNNLVGSFLGSYMVNKTPVPSTSFRAVFLPDSWQNNQIIIPYLFYHGEDRLLLMGTALWEQSLSGAKTNTNNLDLAIFPGWWNSSTPTAAASMLIERLSADGKEAPDAWVGLGYDFVRFASALDLNAQWTPSMVNSRLVQAQNLNWSMAPLRWENGRVRQEMFVFTPRARGFDLAQPAEFRERIDRITERHQRRVEAAKKGK